MKWENPGHEYDELGAYYKNVKTIYLYGSEEDSKSLADQLYFLDFPVVIVDSIDAGDRMAMGMTRIRSAQKAGKLNVKNVVQKLRRMEGKGEVAGEGVLLSDVPIYTPKINYKHEASLPKNLNNGSSILILTGPMAFDIKRVEKKYGLICGKNLYTSSEFMRKYLPIFSVYVRNKVYFPDVAHVCTTVCTLNCEKCLNFAPYDQNKHHMSLDQLKKDADLFFTSVDRVGLYHVTGGEPTTNPDLIELLTYIREKFGDKIYNLLTVTNSVDVLSDDLCGALNKLHVGIQLDDYSRTAKRAGEALHENIKKLRSFGVRYDLLQATEWMSVFPPKKSTKEWDLKEKYDTCSCDFETLKDGKVYTCNYCRFAMTAGIIPDCDTDYFKLSEDDTKINEDYRKRLVEFRMGYSDLGYASFCKYCNGFPNINPETIPPAEQIQGFLTWERPED